MVTTVSEDVYKRQIGIFAINEMGRFYRHVLIQKGYPHHGAVAFSHVGKTLFEVFKLSLIHI